MNLRASSIDESHDCCCIGLVKLQPIPVFCFPGLSEESEQQYALDTATAQVIDLRKLAGPDLRFVMATATLPHTVYLDLLEEFAGGLLLLPACPFSSLLFPLSPPQ
jgi:hypothetical protein